MTYRYRKYLHFPTYNLANTSIQYDVQLAQSVAKLAERVQLQMKTSIFDTFDLSPSSLPYHR